MSKKLSSKKADFTEAHVQALLQQPAPAPVPPAPAPTPPQR
jgi:hypothetical protein